MKELSLNILDIAENSTKAEAEFVEIKIDEAKDTLTITISDNGKGMSAEVLDGVCDPFFTSRTTRKVGMGIPLFRAAAEQTGGSFSITSRHIDDFPDSHGTVVSAIFNKNHIDFTPLGDLISTITTLIQGHPNVNYRFIHNTTKGSVSLDTREIRRVLEDIPLDTFEVLSWIKDTLTEQYQEIKNN